MRKRIVVACLLSLLAGCSSSPTRQQAETMRLIRQADTSYQSGKLAAAKRQYAALVSTNPKFVAGHLRLGAIAYQEGDVPAARLQFETALQLDPRNAQARYNLAMLHLNDAASLLDAYVEGSPSAANRERVLVLLSQLRAFGGKQ